MSGSNISALNIGANSGNLHTYDTMVTLCYSKTAHVREVWSSAWKLVGFNSRTTIVAIVELYVFRSAVH